MLFVSLVFKKMEEPIYISLEMHKYDSNFTLLGTYFKVPVNFKKIKEMTFEELKTSYNTRIVEKNEAHSESPFQKFYDEEMIALINEMKNRINK